MRLHIKVSLNLDQTPAEYTVAVTMCKLTSTVKIFLVVFVWSAGNSVASAFMPLAQHGKVENAKISVRNETTDSLEAHFCVFYF